VVVTETARRGRAAKAPLSRAAVIEAALGIVDREGMDALTMRRLAQELETGAASLYVYVRGRDELLLAMIDDCYARVERTVPEDGDWRARLKLVVRRTVDVLSRHDRLATAGLGRIPTSPGALRLADEVGALLFEGGLDELTVSWGVDLLQLHILASAAELSAFLVRGDTEESVIAALRERVDGADFEGFPTVERLRPYLLAGSGDAREEWALDVLLDGIAARPARD
jgi:AcrR family transcriptional regulator